MVGNMKRFLPLVLGATLLFLVGKYALPSTTINGDRTVSGVLVVSGHTTFEGVTSTGATGTGNLVYATGPTIGLANATGLPVTTGLTGSQLAFYCTDTASSGTTYTSSSCTPFTPAAYVTGMTVIFCPATANTGASTWNLNGLGAKSVIANNTTGSALVANDLLTGTGQCYELQYDGTSFRKVRGPDGAWTAFAYSNSWADFGSSRQVGQYRKLNNGDVEYRGTLAAGTLTVGTTIMTFPAGYRPATLQTTIGFGATAAGQGPGGGNTGYNIAQLDITTAGLMVQQGTATFFNAGGAWVVNGVFSVY